MSQYNAVVDPSVPNASHTVLLDLVEPGSSVLDVGCASGYLAEALRRKGCSVSGVEMDPESAEQARPHLDKVVVGDLETLDLAAEFAGQDFDVIVFGDILEHLREPARVLTAATSMLRPDGAVLISVPNVAHGSLRLALLEGRWRYTETGLLDRTHVHFFTRESLHEMVSSAGLVVTELRATVSDPLACEVAIDEDALPPTAVDWVRRQPDALVYQFVLRAVPGPPSDTLPELVPAVDWPVVHDVHTERAATFDNLSELHAERDRILGELWQVRKEIAGLTQEASQVRAAFAAANAAAAEAERHASAAAEARGEIDRMRASHSWRVGRMLMRGPSAIRRVLRGVRGQRQG